MDLSEADNRRGKTCLHLSCAVEGEQSDDRRQLTCLIENMERNSVPLWSDTSPMLLDCRCCTPCSDAVDCLYYGSPYFIQPYQKQIVSNISPAPINPKQWSRFLKRRQTLASSLNPNKRPRPPPIRARAKRGAPARSDNNTSTRRKLQNCKRGTHDTARAGMADIIGTKHDTALAPDAEHVRVNKLVKKM